MKALFAGALALAGIAAIPQAHAQREAMAAFYQMQMAPSVCGWRDAPSSAKLDAQITAQEQALRITPAERNTFRQAAERDLRADPSNCAADGVVRMMYDEATK